MVQYCAGNHGDKIMNQEAAVNICDNTDRKVVANHVQSNKKLSSLCHHRPCRDRPNVTHTTHKNDRAGGRRPR